MTPLFAAAFNPYALLHAALLAGLVGAIYWRFRTPALQAVFLRNFAGFFISPVGYLFIAAFAVAAGAFAFGNEFFTANLADLEPLNQVFPYLACFLVPAITMSSWSEERRSGTEELLLTLPANDWAVVLGKYAAYVAVYTVALAFAAVHPLVMWWKLGSPDWGLLIHNFIGYWFVGAALVACGMAASALTANVTVSYILGALCCLFFVGLPAVYEACGFAFFGLLNLFPFLRRGGEFEFDASSGFVKEVVSDMSVGGSFRAFSQGLTNASGVWYFVAVAGAMLAVNAFLLGRRHWAGGKEAGAHWLHGAVRFAALACGAGALFVFAQRANSWFFADGTAERLHTPSPSIVALLDEFPKGSEVFVNAFIPPARECPPDLVGLRRDLIDKLRQLGALAGGKARINIVEAEKDSKAGTDAERTHGILPRPVRYQENGESKSTEIIMGVSMERGARKAKIDPVAPGMTIEYELVRALRKVGGAKEKILAIMTTDANLTASSDGFRMGPPPRDWAVVQDLATQVAIKKAAPGKLFQRDDKTKAIKTDDKGEPRFAEEVKDAAALLVVEPSSLGPEELDDLIDYIRSGRPTILLEDPLLAARNGEIGTSRPRPAPGGGGPFGGMPPPPKGDFKKLLDVLNLEFTANAVRRSAGNVLPRMPDLPPEYVYAGPGLKVDGTYSLTHPITRDLKSPLIMFFAGGFTARAGDGPKTTPLLSTDTETFTTDIAKLMARNSEDDPVKGSEPAQRYHLAVHVAGKPVPARNPAPPDGKPVPPPEAKEINVLAIADADLISDGLLSLRALSASNREARDLRFDNGPFFFNAVDFMMGETGLLELRNKRPARLSLTRLAEVFDNADKEVVREIERLNEDSEKAAKEAQKAFAAKNAEKKQAMGPRANTFEGQNELDRDLAVEQNALDAQLKERRDRTRAEIREKRRSAVQKQRELKNNVRVAALLTPLVPALLLGLLVFAVRRTRETEGAVRGRLVN